ncbi:MAG: stage III sporulation AC/AD family protein [Ruminococcus sp.]|jgi:stage III sporulation protein AD|nr:stage III sporulation AC/AD family protein [Ruminococcus sp.]
MKLIQIAALCIIATVLCKILDGRKDYILFIKIAAAAAILSGVILYVAPVTDTVNAVFEKAGADKSYLTVLFRALGICYITQFAADICRDSGESALAVQVELAGKVSLLLLALPMFEALADLVTVLLGI